jgi:hypothetical protein
MFFNLAILTWGTTLYDNPFVCWSDSQGEILLTRTITDGNALWQPPTAATCFGELGLPLFRGKLVDIHRELMG